MNTTFLKSFRHAACMVAAGVVCATSPKAQAADNSLLWDGLHPTEWGSQIIAMAFNDEIGSSGNDSTNVSDLVVCIGDSITAGYGATGYPAYLETMSGKTCVNAGIGGSKSDSGATRVRSLLYSYKPKYLCILYGANDVINGKAVSFTVENLRFMCDSAVNGQTCPLLATLTPMSGTKYGKYSAKVQELNQKIRNMAVTYGYKLIDLESEFE